MIAERRRGGYPTDWSDAEYELKRLSDLGQGLGDTDYNAAYRNLALLKQEAKELQKQLSKTPAQEQKEQERMEQAARASEVLAKKLQEAAEKERDAAAEAERLLEITNSAEVADQHIVDLNQELLDLKQRQAELKEAGVDLGYQEYDQNTDRIAEITKELKEYQKTLSPTDRAAQAQERLNAILEKSSAAYKNISAAIGTIKKTGTGLQDIALLTGGKMSKAFQAAGTAAEAFGTKLSAALSGAAPYIAIAVVAIKAVDSVAKIIAERFKKVFGQMKKTVQISFKVISTAAKTTGEVLSKAFSAAKKFASSAESAFSKIAGNAIKAAQELNPIPKLVDAVGSKFKRLGQMLRRVFVFSVITSGLRTIRTQISAYLSLNEQFSTALRRLQGVLLTAFQPIYEVIVPALTTLINVLSRAIAAVSQFFASLFGTTAKKAQENAKALYGQANALKATGSAAEEAAGSLASFDEINTIQTEKRSGGGGGGGGAADTGPLFDWEYDDTPFDSWGEAFSAFLDKLLAGIPKLEEAFKKFADWLNGFSKKLYDMFTFPDVLEKVEQLGRGLADAFNKLVDWIDWRQLGKALGAGLNLALQFLTEFLYSFDWMNLGRRLADFINGLVSEIDWYDFGRLLWSGFKIGLETLAGILVGLDMPLLAKAASNIVKGFFDEMTNTVNMIPWEEIDRQIVRFFTELDWLGMFSSVFNAMGAVLDAIYAFLFGALDELGERLNIYGITDPLIEMVKTVHDLLKTIAEDTINWIKSINFEPVKNAFSSLLSAVSPLVSLISEGLLWAYENVLLPLASWVIEEATPVLLNALSAAIEFLTAALTALKPVALFVFDNILKPLASFAWGVISGALEVITNILRKLTDLLRGNTTFSDFIDSLAPGEAIILGISTALGILAAAFAVHTVITAASAAISAAVTAIGAALTFLTSPIGIFIAAITALATGFTFLYQHSETFREFVNGIIEGAKQLVPGIISGIESVWDGFKSWWKNLWTGIVEAFKSFFGIHSPSTVFAEFGKTSLPDCCKVSQNPGTLSFLSFPKNWRLSVPLSLRLGKISSRPRLKSGKQSKPRWGRYGTISKPLRGLSLKRLKHLSQLPGQNCSQKRRLDSPG